MVMGGTSKSVKYGKYTTLNIVLFLQLIDYKTGLKFDTNGIVEYQWLRIELRHEISINLTFLQE